MTTARIALPPKLIPVFDGPADVRGAYGGRGSAKTRSFALMVAVRTVMWEAEGREGIILSGRQYMNSLDDSSLDELKSAIRSDPLLEQYFEIGDKFIRTKSGRIHFVFSGLERNIDSVKSKSRILLCWVDEAEPVTESSWQVLIPTLREEDSELWVTWNPRSKRSATHQRFRAMADSSMKIVEMNWRDNPVFPAKLERQRQQDLVSRPDSYDHIWEGGFEEAAVGAYFVRQIRDARDGNRIGCRLGEDPHMSKRAFIDIGGTGARADAFSMWVAQFIGREIRVLNHYERVGQPIGAHLEWLRNNKYIPSNTGIWLPHDGSTQDRVIDVSYESAFRGAGYEVVVVPNQGRGAATQRIESLRRTLPRMWFDEKCDPGIEALAWYHERRDENRGVGLGPEHDWSSHSADSAGLMSIVAERETADSGTWYSDWGAQINSGRTREESNGYRRRA